VSWTASWRARPAPWEWAPVEIVCHLRDEERRTLAPACESSSRVGRGSPQRPGAIGGGPAVRQANPSELWRPSGPRRRTSLDLLGPWYLIALVGQPRGRWRPAFPPRSSGELGRPRPAHLQQARELSRAGGRSMAPLQVEYAGPIPYGRRQALGASPRLGDDVRFAALDLNDRRGHRPCGRLTSPFGVRGWRASRWQGGNGWRGGATRFATPVSRLKRPSRCSSLIAVIASLDPPFFELKKSGKSCRSVRRLVGFVARSDQGGSREIRTTLRPYYNCRQTRAGAVGRTVESFIGDAVMAAFGAPIAHEDERRAGGGPPFAIVQAVQELNAAEPGLELASGPR